MVLLSDFETMSSDGIKPWKWPLAMGTSQKKTNATGATRIARFFIACLKGNNTLIYLISDWYYFLNNRNLR
jgi:hypothetical protein